MTKIFGRRAMEWLRLFALPLPLRLLPFALPLTAFGLDAIERALTHVEGICEPELQTFRGPNRVELWVHDTIPKRLIDAHGVHHPDPVVLQSPSVSIEPLYMIICNME